MAESINLADASSRRISAALDANLAGHVPSGDAFVVSVYGEWGVGKTRCLKQLFQHYDEARSVAISKLGEQTLERLVIPVFFEAWRYEHEQHLIVPLLKTIEQSVLVTAKVLHEKRNIATRAGDVGEQALKLLHRASTTFGDLAVALLSGVKFKFSPLKEVLGIEFDIAPKDMFDTAAKRRTGPAEAPSEPRSWRNLWLARSVKTLKSESARRESLYFDSDGALLALTKPNGDSPFLNFVVLIDDLDRCLPEKAIQVLESVKLFLNVPGFAFVLAIDDEVVERGIAHRYQDYLQPRDTSSAVGAPPISGAEYLEKIVHLPVHLPRWTEDQARELVLSLLAAHCFREEPPATSDRQLRATQPANEPPDDAGHRAEPKTRESATPAQVIDLILHGVPLVPRKLIRLVEALVFQADHFYEKVLPYWSGRHMVRIIALQQLYPALYRHIRLDPTRYWRLFEIGRDRFGDPVYEGDGGRSLADLRALLDRRQTSGKESDADSGTATAHLLEQYTLLEKIREAGEARGAPDPLRLFRDRGTAGLDVRSWQPAADRQRDSALSFEAFARLYIHGLPLPAGSATITAVPAGRTAAGPELKASEIPDIASFISMLLSTDRIGRVDMIEKWGLDDTRLPDQAFGALLMRLDAREGVAPEPVLTDLDWLEDVARIVSPEQLLMIYQRGDVLTRVAAAPTKQASAR
ncbi:MAG: P-loop NTPase fold protein [Gammaproteobacteria bacterium]|nr:P-loop NTPase fold protein [Gammaproteobacteria bacterium]